MKFGCPCCGYRTLSSEKRGSYEICPVCYWEDDKVQFNDPDYKGGANHVSLKDARENYLAFGACESALVSKVRKPLVDEAKEMIHVVYTDNAGKSGERELDKILARSKTMVVRGAAGRKIPHSRVHEGEFLYFMEKGSMKISASAKVISVQNLVKLSDEESTQVLEKHQGKLELTEKQKVRWLKKCLCLVEFAEVKTIAPPLEFDHQTNMDDWLIVEKIEDVLVGTSKPYNYENSRF